MRVHSSPLVSLLFVVGACAAAQHEAAPPVVPAATPSVQSSPPPAAAPLGNPRADLIPRQVLFGNPERTTVRISPDGKYLSWLAPLEGVMNVWVAPVDKLDDARAVTADKTRPVRLYLWAFDGEHLLYLQDKGGDENYHLFRTHAASGEVLDLTPIEGARVEPYDLSERRPHHVMVGINARDPQVFDLYQIDLRTAERTLIAQNDQRFVGYVFDSEQTLRMAMQMAPDGSMVAFSYEPKSRTWTEFDRVGSDDVLTTGFLGYNRAGSHYYAYDSRGRNTGALVLVDAKTKRQTSLYQDARVDVSEVLMHPTERTVQAVQVDYERPSWVAIDKRVQSDLDGLLALGAGGSPHVTSRTLDDKRWLVAIDSDHASPKYYLWDRTTRRGTFLFSARPELDRQPLVKLHPVIIPSRDQLQLVSYLSLPKHVDVDEDGRPEAPAPLVLLVHGGPWGRDGWQFNPLHQLLANRGYAVLSVNFRGSTGFGKDFVNRGNKQWGKQMHDDLLDAVSWAVASKITSAEKTCIMGGSYGGYATLAGLTLTPDVFACGVDIVGPSSIVTLLETIPPYWAPMVSLFHSRVGDPTTPEGRKALLEVSPLTHASAIKRPLLIGQGANDPRVKKSESEQIVRAMQAKGLPVSYVVFPDEGHGFARPENNIAFFAVAEAFLSVHLGGWFQPLSAEELAASTLSIEAGRESLPELPLRARVTGSASGAR